MMEAVLSNSDHPEFGEVTIPLPIPREQYDHCIELVNALEIGSVVASDCHVNEICKGWPVFYRLEGMQVNLDELDYLAKRLESFDVGEYAQFQAMTEKLDLTSMKDLINLTFCCQQATVITDFSDLAAIGRSHYLNTHGGCASTEELEHLDGEETAILLIEGSEGRIIVITGSPGTGKTTTASTVAKESDLEKSVHMHTDDFYHYLSKGAIPPYLPESNEQNLIVIEAFLEAAKRYARGGYDVIVDGIIGPWFLKPWQSLVREHYEVHYIILRASKEETLKRAVERSKLDRKTNIELVETMWEQFCNLGIYESNVVDTTNYSIQETVSAVQEKIASRAALLS